MVIPRENSLVRFYVQLNEVKTDESGRADRSKITPEIILKAAQRTLAPYTLEYKHIHWWTGECRDTCFATASTDYGDYSIPDRPAGRNAVF